MKTLNLMITLALVTAMLAGCKPKSVLRVGELQTESQSVELGDAKSVSVKIKMGAGNLKVNGGAEKLLGSDFTYNVAELKPEVKFTSGTLVIWEPGNQGQIDWRGITDFRNEWSLRLNNELPMDLSVALGAGNSDLQLADLSLTGLDVSVGAGMSTIDLNHDWTRDLDVRIDTGAADVSVRLPKDVGVRVTLQDGPHVLDAPGFKQDGSVFTNATYGSSQVTLQINIRAGIGAIHLALADH